MWTAEALRFHETFMNHFTARKNYCLPSRYKATLAASETPTTLLQAS
jgi:hypothetical protein